MALQWHEPLTITFERSYGDAGDPFDDQVTKYNHGRELALCGGYDAMLTVEADMIVPADALIKLADVSAGIVRGLYVSRHDDRMWYAFRSAYTDRTDAIVDDLSHDTAQAQTAIAEQRVITTVGGGFGCTLIRRHVLEDIAFRVEGALPCDWWYSLDARKRGHMQAHHCGVVCGHVSHGRVAWPDPTRETMYKETTC